MRSPAQIFNFSWDHDSFINLTIADSKISSFDNFKFTQVGTVAQAQTSLIRAFLKVLVFEKLEKNGKIFAILSEPRKGKKWYMLY